MGLESRVRWQLRVKVPHFLPKQLPQCAVLHVLTLNVYLDLLCVVACVCTTMCT